MENNTGKFAPDIGNDMNFSREIKKKRKTKTKKQKNKTKQKKKNIHKNTLMNIIVVSSQKITISCHESNKLDTNKKTQLLQVIKKSLLQKVILTIN